MIAVTSAFFSFVNSRLLCTIQTLVDRDLTKEYTVTDPVNNLNCNGCKLIDILKDCDLFVMYNMI